MNDAATLVAAVCAALSAGVAVIALRLLSADRQASLQRIARLERDLALALASRDAQDWARRVAEADEVEQQRAQGQLDKDGIERVPTLWEEEQQDRKAKHRARTEWMRM